MINFGKVHLRPRANDCGPSFKLPLPLILRTSPRFPGFNGITDYYPTRWGLQFRYHLPQTYDLISNIAFVWKQGTGDWSKPLLLLVWGNRYDPSET